MKTKTNFINSILSVGCPSKLTLAFVSQRKILRCWYNHDQWTKNNTHTQTHIHVACSLTWTSSTKHCGRTRSGRGQLPHDRCPSWGGDRSGCPCCSGGGGLCGRKVIFLQLQKVSVSSVDGTPAHLQSVGAGSHKLDPWWGCWLLCTHTVVVWNMVGHRKEEGEIQHWMHKCDHFFYFRVSSWLCRGLIVRFSLDKKQSSLEWRTKSLSTISGATCTANLTLGPNLTKWKPHKD